MAPTRKRAAKPRPGRKLRAGDPTKLWAIRLTEAELDNYKAAAKAAAKSVSEWVRGVLNDAYEQISRRKS
jgi:hypothetical protein